jgi:c-di-GMP-related signal transduction protein
MFSLLDAMIDRPMKEIVCDLNLPPEMQIALLQPSNSKSVPAAILRLVLAYEGAEWPKVQDEADRLKITSRHISTSYLNSLNWVTELLAARGISR